MIPTRLPGRATKQRQLGRKYLLAVLALVAVAGLILGSLAHFLRKPAVLQVVEYPMLEKLDIPTAIAVSRTGTVWVTIDSSDAIAIIEDGKLRRFSKGSRNVEPLGIGIDSAGNAWIADAPAVAIKRVTATGEVSGVPLDTPIARLARLAVAPDDAVWFAESTAYSITRLKDGQLNRHEFPPQRGGPFGVAVGADGMVWATMQSGNLLLRLAPNGQIAEYEVPTRASSPTDIAVDAQGRAWFLEFRGNKVGMLENGQITEYEVPTPSAGLSGITVAPDGTVWFGMLRAHALGRIRDGKVEVLPFPRPEARPFTLAADAQGNIWYADISGYVGKVTADSAGR